MTPEEKKEKTRSKKKSVSSVDTKTAKASSGGKKPAAKGRSSAAGKGASEAKVTRASSGVKVKKVPPKITAKKGKTVARAARPMKAEAGKATAKPATKKSRTAARKAPAKKAPVRKAMAKPAAKARKRVARKAPAEKAPQREEVYQPRLLRRYKSEVVGQLMEKFGYKNALQVPRMTKISLNTGVGKAREDPKDLEGAQDDLGVISGQKAVVTKAKMSVSNFKIRQGDPVGCRVTLRYAMMYEFLDRLIAIAIPRVRDFNGLRRKSFDGQGNYSLGIKEQIVFPEVDYDKVTRIRGLDVTITTTAKSDEEGLALLESLGMPFRRSV